MRIMICDDEAPIRELLKAKLERYFFPRSIEFSIQTCESGEALLKRDLSQIDVLLLDVDMPGMSGMETAAEVRKTDQQLLIVFLTAYSEFVFESFKVDAFRYLLKPLKDAELDEVLQAVQQRLYAGDGECLNFQFQNETYHIRVLTGAYLVLFLAAEYAAILIWRMRRGEKRSGAAIRGMLSLVLVLLIELGIALQFHIQGVKWLSNGDIRVTCYFGMATAQYCIIVLREIQAVGPGFKKMLLIALAIRAVENLIWLAICIAPIKFTVTAAHEIIWDGANRTGVLTDLTGKAMTGEITFTANTDKSELATKVVNKKGATLPSTGGIGTTIFYVVGGGLMAAAVVLFITKKRMENDQ